ncbi:MAG: hypothetical protein AAF206_20520 [Bacteroidota bacterium]
MIRNILSILGLIFLVVACQPSETEDPSTQQAAAESPVMASVKEENFDLRNDSVIFSSGTIENFDQDGKSINVFWLGEAQDTVLRFYRKYDSNQQLIGAEYYEEGDTEPSRDTVFVNAEGKKVEASLNAANQISWKSIITTDANDNPVLKTYENGKGEYRGFDSLFFDGQDRVVKGFYENGAGKRYSIKTYEYVAADDYGNWTERKMYKDGKLQQKQVRNLTYHE